MGDLALCVPTCSPQAANLYGGKRTSHNVTRGVILYLVHPTVSVQMQVNPGIREGQILAEVLLLVEQFLALLKLGFN